MARKKRVWYPGAIYHVMSRGNRRAPIFTERSDYLWFLEYILLLRERYPFKVHSLCLMTNHFHMAIETKTEELWKIMRYVPEQFPCRNRRVTGTVILLHRLNWFWGRLPLEGAVCR